MLDTSFWRQYDGQETGDLVLRPVVGAEDLSTYFDIQEGIKGKQVVYFLEPVEYIVKKDPGCGLGRDKQDAQISREQWSPVDFKVWKYMCWEELRDKVFEWMLKDGNEKPDIQDTDYVDYMLEVIKDGIFNDMVRIAWFADANMDVNKLTDPAKLKFYNQYDGVFVQLEDAKAAEELTYIPMEFTRQKAGAAVGVMETVNVNDYTKNPGQLLPDDFAINLFETMYESQPEELDGMDEANRLWMVSKDIYSNYRKSLRKLYKNVELAYVELTNGKRVIAYEGIPILQPKVWQKYIKKDFKKVIDSKNVYDSPHRAIMTQKGNFKLGFDSKPATNNKDAKLKIFYDEMTETINGKMLYVSDVRIPRKDLIVYAK